MYCFFFCVCLDPNYSEADKITQLCSFLREYICDQLAQTNIFGHYVDTQNNGKNKDILLKNENIKNLCKKLVFGSDLEELNKLIRYCLTQNISNIDSYEGELNATVSFIVNELAYVIYHDLTINWINNSTSNSNNSHDSLLFPKLLKMFQLIYNLSCYICCYPFEWSKEYFYVKQYFNLRNTLYTNIFGNNNKENKEISHSASKLSNYNYFCYFDYDGSLLHRVCYTDYHQYCDILIKNGFDMKQANRYGKKTDGSHQTPYKIAQKYKYENILVLFRSLNINNNNSNNNNRENDLPVSIMKSMEDICDVLLKQIMFSKYFLVCMGINNVGDDVEMKIEQEFLNGSCRPYMTDVLYVQFDKLQAVLSVVGENKKEMNAINVMNTILSILIKLIDTRMIISDELLMLCWVYYNVIDNNKSRSKHIMVETEINISKDEFLKHLLNCVSDCLSDKSEDEYNYKTRNYIYFKEFLLHNNIWYCKDNKNNKLLFEYVGDLVDKLIIKQKEYIRDSIENEEKQDNQEWNKLCNFNKYNNSEIQFRQDRINNGIKSFKSVKDAYLAAIKISNPQFDVLTQFNDKIYLTQCLAFANENNDYFQSEMKKLFNGKGAIKKAPVKTFDRCLVKSS